MKKKEEKQHRNETSHKCTRTHITRVFVFMSLAQGTTWQQKIFNFPSVLQWLRSQISSEILQLFYAFTITELWHVATLVAQRARDCFFVFKLYSFDVLTWIAFVKSHSFYNKMTCSDMKSQNFMKSWKL